MTHMKIAEVAVLCAGMVACSPWSKEHLMIRLEAWNHGPVVPVQCIPISCEDRVDQLEEGQKLTRI